MRTWQIQNISFLIPLVLVSLVGAYALFRCRGDKRSFFVLVTFAAFMHILGYYLGTVRTDVTVTEMYLVNFGGGLCALANVLFISEYCDTKVRASVKLLLCAGTFLYIMGVWTTGLTSYYSSDFELNFNSPNPRINSQGVTTWIIILYHGVYISIALIILIRKIILSRGELRKTLIIILIASVSPVLAALIDGSGYFSSPLFLTPYAYGVSAIIYYIAIKKYDMLNKSPLSSMQAINAISHAVILLDDKLRYISANSAAISLLPWLRDCRTDEAIYCSPHWPSELSRSAFSDGEFSVAFMVQDFGSSRHFNATAHPFNSTVSRRKHWSIMVQDTTDKELFIRQLEEAAYTDKLTSLYNRRHFTEIAMPYVERSKRSGMSFFVMIADLDLFKETNDEYGHLAGDTVLRHAAAIMKSTVRSYDIVARWGGEEFIFLITDSYVEEVAALAERIRQTIERTVCVYDGTPLPITISFGIAQSDDANTDLNELIIRADAALYDSKQNGRNRVTMWSRYA